MRQTEEDIDEIDAQIKKEIAQGIIVSTSGESQQAQPGTGGVDESSDEEQESPPAPQSTSDRQITIGEVVPPSGAEK